MEEEGGGSPPPRTTQPRHLPPPSSVTSRYLTPPPPAILSSSPLAPASTGCKALPLKASRPPPLASQPPPPSPRAVALPSPRLLPPHFPSSRPDLGHLLISPPPHFPSSFPCLPSPRLLPPPFLALPAGQGGLNPQPWPVRVGSRRGRLCLRWIHQIWPPPTHPWAAATPPHPSPASSPKLQIGGPWLPSSAQPLPGSSVARSRPLHPGSGMGYPRSAPPSSSLWVSPRSDLGCSDLVGVSSPPAVFTIYCTRCLPVAVFCLAQISCSSCPVAAPSSSTQLESALSSSSQEDGLQK